MCVYVCVCCVCVHINSDIKELKNLIPWLLKSASDNIVEKLKEVVSEYDMILMTTV